MKVQFTYTPTDRGYKLDLECSDVPTLPNSSTFDKEQYYECFEAIQEAVADIISTREIMNK